MTEVTARLSVKVVPGASRSAITGWLGDRLKVRVTSPAEGGKANTALRALLADALGVPQSSVVIIAGSASPRKVVEVQSLSGPELRARLSRHMA